MYCEFFSLRCRPFDDRADSRFFFPTDDREEALAVMEYEAHYGEGMALVVGEAGTGKTLLIRTLLPKLAATDRVVVLTWAASAERSVIREAAKAFGLSLPSTNQEVRALSRMQRSLSRFAKAGQRSILIIDQAENLNEENLAQLTTLTGLRRNGQKLLNVILAGQPQLHTLLDQPAFSRIAQQLFGGRSLAPFSRETTGRYVEHRLRIAGAQEPASVFEGETMELIHEVSRGLPRLINRICNTAMVIAYGAGLKRIDKTIVVEAIQQAQGDRGIPEPRVVSQNTVAASTVEPDSATSSSHPASCSVRFAAQPAGSNIGASEAAPALPPLSPPASAAIHTGDPSWEPASSADYAGIGSAPGYEAEADPACAGPDFSTPEAMPPDAEWDRTIAHAESVHAAVQSSLSRCSDAEGRLATLATSAERIIWNLTETLRHAGRSQEQREKRITELLTQAESTAQALDVRVKEAQSASTNITGDIDRFQEAFAEAGRVEAGLKSYAEHLADRADEVQQHSARLMDSADVGERVYTKLAKLLQDAPKVTDETEQSLNSLQEKLRQTQSEAGDWRKNVLAETVALGRKEVEEQLADMQRRQRAEFEKFLESHRKSIQSLMDQTTRDRQQFEAVVAAEKQQCEQAVNQNRKRFEDETRTFHERVAESCRTLETAFHRRDDLHNSVQSVNHQIREASQHAESLKSTVRQAEKRTETLEARAETVTTTLAEATDRAVQTVNDAGATLGDLKTVQRQAAALVAEAGTVDGHLQTLRESLEAGKELAAELSARESQGDRVLNRLTSTVENAEGVLIDLQDVSTKANHRAEQTAADMKSNISELQAIRSRTENLIAQFGNLDEQSLKDTVTAGKELAAELTARHAEGLRVRDLLTSTVDGGQEVFKHLQTLSMEASNKIGQLDSHHAAAANLMRRLVEAAGEGTTVADRLEEVEQRVQETVASTEENVDHRTREVWDLTTRTEVMLKQLSEKNAESRELLDAYRNASEPTRGVLAQLKSRADDAQQLLAEMDRQSEQARHLAERVAGITHLMSEVQRIDGSVQETTQRAMSIRDEMLSASESAAQNALALEELNAVACGLVETFEQVKLETQHVTQEFHSEMASARETIEHRRSLSESIREQSSAIETTLDELRNKAQRIEQALIKATARPADIVNVAQSQAVQLERVCSATQKVFRGLSKAALEAREQSASFHESSRQAEERLQRLTEQTNRASVTLHEWVQEAVRVQARLENTLGQAPSLAETHPAGSLRRLSENVTPMTSRIANLGATGTGTLEVLRDAPRSSPKEVNAAPAPPANPDRISQLIEDAKKAVETGPAHAKR